MKPWHSFIASLLLLLTFSALGADDRLTLTGSSTMAPLAGEIAKRFEALHAGVRVDVQTGGSSRGLADARTGRADIGMVSRALKPAESDLNAHLVAKDGIGIIVHASNTVAALSPAQIKAIYTGEIDNWAAIGGKNAPITVVNKAEGRSTLELFLAHFDLKNSELEPDVIIGDNQQGIKTVSGNANGVGYVSVGTAEYEVARGTPIKLLPMSAVEASVENVRNGTFPLSRELNFVTRGEPGGLARRFIEFAQSKAVNDLIEAQFFVPLAR